MMSLCLTKESGKAGPERVYKVSLEKYVEKKKFFY